MAPVAQDDIDVDTRASDLVESQDSPLRRQFSEPAHPLSNSIRASSSPTPSTRRSKCAWCGKYFETSDEDGVSHDEALKEHMATVHPHIAKFSMYDGANDEEDDGGEDGEDQEEQDDQEEEQDDQDDQEEEEEVDETPLDESELAISNQLHGFSRQQRTASVQKRLESFWNIHKASNFSKDYDDEIAELEHTWDYAFRGPKRSKKRDASEFPDRPDPYKKPAVSKGEFLQITPIETFLEQLRDPESRPFDELYAITSNVAHALKVWQDEYMAIDRLSKLASRYMMKRTADPRKTEDPEVFEDKKEAMLYGYKYSTRAPTGYQDPFIQGGFRPTAAQYRKMSAQAGPNNPNPDGWKPIVKFGIEYVPRFQNPPIGAFEGKNTRKRKAAQEAANSANENKEATTTTETPAVAETENEADAPPAKRQTRSRGGKQPTTTSRETAQTNTAPSSPASSVRPASSGRGGRRPRSQAATPQPTPSRSSARGPARGAQSANNVTPATTAAATTTTAPVASIAPNGATTTAAATATVTTAAPASVIGAPLDDPNLDPAELARRQKIANSKNPKRTEAMLNHWARFNREGRVRNPKRTKAQIEADRAAEALRKAQEPPKPNSRKRKNAGATTNGAASGPKKSKTDPAVPPPVQPMPPPSGSAPPAGSIPPSSSLPPAGSIQPSSSLPPAGSIPPPPPPIQPYAPIEPRTVAPHPYPHGPPPPLAPSQPGPPPQPHPMAYVPPGYPTDYYIHYPGPHLPPPAHPRAEAHTRPR